MEVRTAPLWRRQSGGVGLEQMRQGITLSASRRLSSEVLSAAVKGFPIGILPLETSVDILAAHCLTEAKSLKFEARATWQLWQRVSIMDLIPPL